ncbi:MAG: zf-HC2 domain-containing protein [Micrococcaceae bacterium]
MTDCEKLGNCSEERMQKLEAYLDGQLSSQEVELVKQHIQECEDCQNECNVETIIRDALKRCCNEKAPESLKAKLANL